MKEEAFVTSKKGVSYDTLKRNVLIVNQGSCGNLLAESFVTIERGCIFQVMSLKTLPFLTQKSSSSAR